MLGLGVLDLVVVVGAAVVVGFAKTAVGGAASLAVAMFASVMPARESTAALLLVLIVGDVVAVSTYRRSCDWRVLVRMLPWVLPGLLVGAAFISQVDDTWMRRTIGAILVVVVGLQLVERLRSRRRATASDPDPVDTAVVTPRTTAPVIGVAAGFCTMVANAGGAVMTSYLIAAGFEKRLLIGTAAWFFLVVNLVKVPFSAGLGLISADTVWLTLTLVPAVLVGAFVGVRVIGRIDQKQFEVAALSLSVVGAVLLVV